MARAAMPRGDGSLLFATSSGVRVARLTVSPAPEPAPTWWAHLAGCAWVAAWLTARGRDMLGPRELLADDSWSGVLTGVNGARSTAHRPDLVGVVPGRRPAAIEVELARKSKTRLRAILALHLNWIAAGQSGACVYVCRDEGIGELVSELAEQVGLRTADRSIRVELLSTIQGQARAASATHLTDEPARAARRTDRSGLTRAALETGRQHGIGEPHQGAWVR